MSESESGWGCGGLVLGLVAVMAIVGTLLWHEERGNPFGSRHGLFGGAPLEPVSGTVVFAETSGPDGRTAALRTVDATGGDVTDVAAGLPPMDQVTPSPDGDRLAFVTGEPGREQLRVVTAGPRRPGATVAPPGGVVSAQTPQARHDVAWAPDGSAVAFVADIDPNDNGAAVTLNVAQVTGDRPGPARSVALPVRQRRTCITYGGGDVRRCMTSLTGEPTSVHWLPGDRGLVYTASFEGDEEVRGGEVKATSKGYGQIGRLSPGDLSLPPELVEREFAWGLRSASPDGRYLLLEDEDDHGRIVDLRAARPWRDAVRIGRQVYAPSWSPDGERLLFMDDSRLFTARADGRDVRAVAHIYNETNRANPSVKPREAMWSPDGRHIAWSGTDFHDTGVVMVMNADGTGQTAVHETTGDVRVLAWTSS